jgi:hypothetical protein
LATIKDFNPFTRPLVKKTIGTVRGFSWKIYEDPSPKHYLALKMHGNLICGFYPRVRGFSLGYWHAPAGRRGTDRWVRCLVRDERELKIHLAMIRARVIHVLTGTP